MTEREGRMLHRWHYRSLRAMVTTAPSRRPSCVGLEATSSVSTNDRAQLECVEGLFVNAPLGFHIGDCDGRILSANRALSLLLGFDDPAACEGIRFADLFEDDDDVAAQLMERVRRGDTVTDMEILLQGPDGEPRRASINVTGRCEDGELVCTRWITRPHLSDTDADHWAARLMDEIDVRPAIDRMTRDEQADRLAELEDFLAHCPAALIAWG